MALYAWIYDRLAMVLNGLEYWNLAKFINALSLLNDIQDSQYLMYSFITCDD
jgi:hypothetical protein